MPSPTKQAAQEQAFREGNREWWHNMLPFSILTGFFLLVLFWYLNWASGPAPSCEGHSEPYVVKVGETCWTIANRHGVKPKTLLELNPGVHCQRLLAGNNICVPTET